MADTIADVESGYSTKEGAYKQLKQRFDTAILEFEKEYGFRPYKAGELIKNAWVIEE